MVQKASEYAHAQTDEALKLQLINTLRSVSEGKIFVELERVRLTKGMSAHHLDDELGQYDSAAGDSGGEESIAVGATPSTYQTLVVKKL